ncbi:hypothetical protein M9Y10_021999 [Tritrichomonas musculus]|uniref:VOC domain-containing protein n=1 Tax=Tritrichomonas musculus TaxID=1915356 RepID=A0ABR2KRB1_9EUKA
MSAQPLVQSFNHIGLVVPSIKEARHYWTDILGVPTTEPAELAKGLLICFAEMSNAKVEIIEPLDPNCPHAQWLKEHPKGGLHHFCLNTRKLEPAVDDLAKKGVTTDMKEPLVLTTGERVIFFNEDTTMGATTELYETEK